jgi:hypothetical protein
MVEYDNCDKKETPIIDNLSPNWGIMLTMQENLNIRIGTKRKKKYISAAFWNYISTPINFVITLFTALSASQTGTTNNFLSTNQVFYILLSTFVLSIINTFFKLKEKAQLNYDAAKMYEIFGSEFEDIYFTPIMEHGDVGKKLKAYNELHKKIMTYASNENIDGVNYITELIFYLWSKKIHGRFRQIEMDEQFWVLDGKPKWNYKNNYRVEMNNFFKDDFDKDMPQISHEEGIVNHVLCYLNLKNKSHPSIEDSKEEDESKKYQSNKYQSNKDESEEDESKENDLRIDLES